MDKPSGTGAPASKASLEPASPEVAVTMRPAAREDLEAIVRMLADDPLGGTREQPDRLHPYADAFEAVAASPDNELVVTCMDGEVVGVLQLTFLPGLTYGGRTRAQIEGVRVRRDRRGGGIGRAMIAWAIERAQAHGCRLVQLTTDRQRPEALAFYEELGFVASHEGLKLHLE